MATQDKFNRAINDGDRLDDGYFNGLATLMPIGGITAWAKSFTNVPALPDGWLECDGSVISDSDSPLNGQTLPDLNGDNRFLRGNSTSGTTGGSATHSLTTAELAAHTHAVNIPNGTGGTGVYAEQSVDTSGPGISETSGSTGSGEAHNNEPQYYNIVWIMRIK